MNEFERGLDPKEAMDIGDARIRKMMSVGMDEHHIKKMSQVKFFVEANSYEMFKLWQENKNEYDVPCQWDEHHLGHAFTIGSIANRPINLEFHFASLDGILVCFYCGISELVDYKMIEDFITFCWPIKYDGGSRRAMTDAQNFHHCIQYCKNPY